VAADSWKKPRMTAPAVAMKATATHARMKLRISNFLRTRALCAQVESLALPISLFWSMILSEKSATLRDHALSIKRDALEKFYFVE
jgi:hypothetical protein